MGEDLKHGCCAVACSHQPVIQHISSAELKEKTLAAQHWSTVSLGVQAAKALAVAVKQAASELPMSSRPSHTAIGPEVPTVPMAPHAAVSRGMAVPVSAHWVPSTSPVVQNGTLEVHCHWAPADMDPEAAAPASLGLAWTTSSSLAAPRRVELPPVDACDECSDTSTGSHWWSGTENDSEGSNDQPSDAKAGANRQAHTRGQGNSRSVFAGGRVGGRAALRGGSNVAMQQLTALSARLDAIEARTAPNRPLPEAAQPHKAPARRKQTQQFQPPSPRSRGRPAPRAGHSLSPGKRTPTGGDSGGGSDGGGKFLDGATVALGIPQHGGGRFTSGALAAVSEEGEALPPQLAPTRAQPSRWGSVVAVAPAEDDRERIQAANGGVVADGCWFPVEAGAGQEAQPSVVQSPQVSSHHRHC